MPNVLRTSSAQTCLKSKTVNSKKVFPTIRRIVDICISCCVIRARGYSVPQILSYFCTYTAVLPYSSGSLR